MPSTSRALRAMLVLATCPCLTLSAQRAAPDPARALLGVWEGRSVAFGLLESALRLRVRLDSLGRVRALFEMYGAANAASPVRLAVSGDTVRIVDIVSRPTIAVRSGRDTLVLTSDGTVAPIRLARVPGGTWAGVHALDAPAGAVIESHVTTTSAPGIVLDGTLARPAHGMARALAILLGGSGPNDRDYGPQPGHVFRRLAHVLAAHGIASLRFDDRGVDMSTGDATTASFDSLLVDARAMVRAGHALPASAGRACVVPVGHSLGAVQAALLAAEDTTLGAAVLLAGPLMRGDSATIAQARMSVSRANAELSAFPEARSAYTSAVARGVELLRSGLDSAAADRILVAERDSVIARIRRRAGRDTVWLYEDAGAKQGYFAARRLLSSWWMRGGYLSARPAAALAHGRVPVLALYGDADAQVAVPENVAALRAALAGRDTSGWSVETIAGLDHAFATPIPDVRWHTISPEAIRSQAAYDRALMDETSARAREVWRSFDARVMDRIAAWITRWCVAPSRR